MQKKIYGTSKLKDVQENTDERTFEAIASTPDLDRHGEVVSEEALKSVETDDLSLLLHHDPREVVGRIEVLGYENGGLKVKGYLAKTPKADETYELLKMGGLSKLSIGFIAKDMNDNAYTEIELCEISIVSVPANPNASITEVKSLEGKKKEEKSMEELEKKVDDLAERVNALEGIVKSNEEKEKEKEEEKKLEAFEKMFELEKGE